MRAADPSNKVSPERTVSQMSSTLRVMGKHEDLRAIALDRLRQPLQASMFAACVLCDAQIGDFRDERRPAGPDGPVLCLGCARQAEQRMAKAVPMVAGIEQMTTPYGHTSLDTLTGTVLGYYSKRLGAALSLDERVVLQIAAYRHWLATHARAAA